MRQHRFTSLLPLAFSLISGCADDDLIARYTRESDLQQRANCICPLNGTTASCLDEVELRYPSNELQDCQRRVIAMHPDMRDAVSCITDTLHALRPCFDNAYLDCTTADEATCGAQFHARSNECPRPSDEASRALMRCAR